jgi:hypothetical protein
MSYHLIHPCTAPETPPPLPAADVADATGSAQGDGPVLTRTVAQTTPRSSLSGSFSVAVKPTATGTTNAGAQGSASGDIADTRTITYTNPYVAVSGSVSYGVDTPGGIRSTSAKSNTDVSARGGR